MIKIDTNFVDYNKNECIFIDSFESIKKDFGKYALSFLNLSGRELYYSQGIYGQGETIAVIDSGVYPHEEFEDRLLIGKNFNKFYDINNTNDDLGHGTHCAGSIAGKNVGIAPKCKILPIKVIGSNGGVSNIESITEAVNWVNNWRDNNGNKVTAISMSISNTSKIYGNELYNLEQAIKNCINNNIAVFCSMGNSSKEEIRYPAGFDDVIAVGAVDQNKNQVKFSTTGHQCDVCQVGVDVISCIPGGGYAKKNGTSMSTPIVAGIAALIACRYKRIYNKRIPERILYEAIKMNTKDLGIEGIDKIFGAGFCTLQPLSMKIELEVGNTNMVCNDEIIDLETEPIINNDIFYIPLKPVIEVIGGYVNYDEVSKKAQLEF